MDVKELEEKLKEINPSFWVDSPSQTIYYVNGNKQYWFYSIKHDRLNSKYLYRILTDDQRKRFIEVINNYPVIHDYPLHQLDKSEKEQINPFKELTDHLADVLLKKNKAYGDSFTKSVDQFGNTVIVIRLSDKFNRVCSLIGKDELKENDESLQDTLLDMAGYSILALKYLKEHENE